MTIDGDTRNDGDQRTDDETPADDEIPVDDETSVDGGSPTDGVTDEEVVAAAVEAAEAVLFARYRRTEIRDVDVTVRFEDGVLDVDVYLNVPGAEDAERVADDAALSAQDAVDDLLE